MKTLLLYSLVTVLLSTMAIITPGNRRYGTDNLLSLENNKGIKLNDLLSADEKQLRSTKDNKIAEKIRAYLKSFYRLDIERHLIDSASRNFFFEQYDLNNDGKDEIFIELTGPYFCGSGGCTLILLAPDYKLITSFSVSRTPIIIAQTASQGWKDLIIYSNGKNRLVKFSAGKYAANPSIKPAFRASIQSSFPTILDSANKQYEWYKF